MNYIERNTLLTTGEFLENPAFHGFRKITVDSEEAYAANCLWINGTVLVPEGFPEAKTRIETAGYDTIAVDVSEFHKIDGGLSCLSLRF